MKFGISAATFDLQFGPIVFRGSDVARTFDSIAGHGYDGIDLFTHHLFPHEIGAIRRAAESSGVEIAMLVAIWVAESGGSLTDLDDGRRRKTVDLLKEHLELAGEFGATVPIGFLRGARGDRDEREYRKVLAESLRELEECAVKNGAVVVLEPINRYEIDTFARVDESLAFLDEHGLSKIQLLPDVFHMNIEERDPIEAFCTAGDRIGHVHCSDTNRYAPGQGHFDYAAMFAALHNVGYDGYVSIESPPVPTADEIARQGIEYLRQFSER